MVGGSVLSREGEPSRAFHRRRVAAESGAGPQASRIADEASAAERLERANRRARGQVRRYCTANAVQRLLTLTYRPPQPVDVAVVRRDVTRFLRRLRADRPDLAYVWTLERHRSGALHVHVGLGSSGTKLSAERLAWLWGHGFIDIRKIRVKGRRASARVVAVYLAKYVTKESARADGGHRYDVREGRQPEVARAATTALAEGLAQLMRLAGGEVPAYVWTSGELVDWRGPPVAFVSWE